MSYHICLIPGDGIGQEVVPATRRVLEASGLTFTFTEAEAGWETFEKTGESVPEETVDKITAADATLAGAFTSPNKKVAGFKGAIRYLRRRLDLFANLRPAKSRPIEGIFKDVDQLIVRENTQGLYVEQERRYGDLAIADTVITKEASRRIGEVAVQEALKRRKQLTVIHKANVLPVTQGLFLETVMGVAAAHPELKVNDVIVDAAAMMLVRGPQRFDVLVATNLFGDILSDLTAGLVGGLGIAPSANIGSDCAIFEPVHGSAPDITGKGVANPIATILTAAMMLEHLGEKEPAARLERTVDGMLKSGPLTGDLGGTATTEEFTDAFIRALA